MGKILDGEKRTTAVMLEINDFEEKFKKGLSKMGMTVTYFDCENGFGFETEKKKDKTKLLKKFKDIMYIADEKDEMFKYFYRVNTVNMPEFLSILFEENITEFFIRRTMEYIEEGDYKCCLIIEE